MNAPQNVEATLVFRAKMGLALRDEDTLRDAAAIAMETLEDFGYSVSRCRSRRAHRVLLECDHYDLELRHRRSPDPMRCADGTPCPAQLELLLRPHFPRHADREISEILLVATLYELLQALDAEVIEWLDTAVPITPEDFLAAFELASVPEVAPQDTGQNTGQNTGQEIEPTYAKPAFVETEAGVVTTDYQVLPEQDLLNMPFQSVDATWDHLVQQYEEITGPHHPSVMSRAEPLDRVQSPLALALREIAGVARAATDTGASLLRACGHLVRDILPTANARLSARTIAVLAALVALQTSGVYAAFN